jgi:F420-dependent methylenetetrahydromethanopterin dehydrogenase
LEIDGRVKALTLQAASENLRVSEAQASELKALKLARTIASVAQAAAITTEESRYTTAETQLATELAREDALIAERARELREARALESQERQRCVEK